MKSNIAACSLCGGITEKDPCTICDDSKRDSSLICVVEVPADIYAFERTSGFNGVYHVLGGVLSPLDGIGPEELNIPKLFSRLENENIKVAYMPERHSSVGVGEVFTKLNALGKKAIIPRSGASTPFLKNLLEKIGINVVELYLYDVCAFRDPTEWNEFRQLFSQNKIDGVIFTSV